jgi:hypothetical protein
MPGLETVRLFQAVPTGEQKVYGPMRWLRETRHKLLAFSSRYVSTASLHPPAPHATEKWPFTQIDISLQHLFIAAISPKTFRSCCHMLDGTRSLKYGEVWRKRLDGGKVPEAGLHGVESE